MDDPRAQSTSKPRRLPSVPSAVAAINCRVNRLFPRRVPSSDDGIQSSGRLINQRPLEAKSILPHIYRKKEGSPPQFRVLAFTMVTTPRLAYIYFLFLEASASSINAEHTLLPSPAERASSNQVATGISFTRRTYQSDGRTTNRYRTTPFVTY